MSCHLALMESQLQSRLSPLWKRYQNVIIFIGCVIGTQLMLASLYAHRMNQVCPVPITDGVESLISSETKWPVVQHVVDRPQVMKRKDGECRCKPAWIGASCDFDFFNSTHYLPQTVEKQEGWARDAKKLWKEFATIQMAGWSQKDIDELYSKPSLQTLVNLQNGVQLQPFDDRFEGFEEDIPKKSKESCQACEEWSIMPTGIASDIRELAASLVDSWMMGSPLIPELEQSWLWARNVNRSYCEVSKSYDCFLEGVTPKCSSRCVKGTRKTKGFQSWERTPDERNSIIWLQSQAISFLLRRPKPFVQEYILEQLRLLNLPLSSSPEERTVKIVGMHVRMGDACFDTFSPRKCIPFEEYVDAMRSFHRVYNVTHVYIATDSQDVIDSLVNYPEFQWHYLQGIDRRKYNSEVLIEERAHHDILDQTKEVTLTLAETFFLSQCDGFIGTFSSNFGRAAFELMMARRQAWPPYITLDIPWCYHWVVINKKRWAKRDVTSSCSWV